MADKPRIAVTIGDPAGIGPEVALKAAADPAVRAICDPVLVGDESVLRLTARGLDLDDRLTERRLADSADTIAYIDVPAVDMEKFEIGAASADCGRAILAFTDRAVAMAVAGEVDAVVAAPQTQSAIEKAGVKFDGYPSYIAGLTGTDPADVFLMLSSDRLRIVHVTLHVGLRTALDMIDEARVLRAIRAGARALERLGFENPRIAVAGINPHGGEGGLFGSEEIEIVAPAIHAAQEEGIRAEGPFGADTMYLRDDIDGFVVMYHDQGHVPAKLIGFDRTAAYTIGTPVTFASVAHGSAYDIAGKGIADAGALSATLMQMKRVI